MEGVRPVFPEGTPQAYRELAEQCWAPEPERRCVGLQIPCRSALVACLFEFLVLLCFLSPFSHISPLNPNPQPQPNNRSPKFDRVLDAIMAMRADLAGKTQRLRRYDVEVVREAAGDRFDGDRHDRTPTPPESPRAADNDNRRHYQQQQQQQLQKPPPEAAAHPNSNAAAAADGTVAVRGRSNGVLKPEVAPVWQKNGAAAAAGAPNAVFIPIITSSPALRIGIGTDGGGPGAAAAVSPDSATTPSAARPPRPPRAGAAPGASNTPSGVRR